MATGDKRIIQLSKASITAKDGVFAIVDPILDVTVQIAVQEALGATRASFDWQSDVTYALDAIVLYNGLTAWKSLQASNTGNVPAENTFWTSIAISLADGITLTSYAIGLFTYDNSIIIEANNIYQLAAPAPFESTDIAAEITSGDWVSILVDPAGGFLLKSGDSMTGALQMQNAEMQIYDSLGNLRGALLAEMNFGAGLVGKNDVQGATELLLLGDPLIFGREEIGLKFNGASEDSFLAIGKSYDFNGETIFPLFSIPLPPPTVEETFTDNLDYALLAGNTQIILTGILVNNYAIGSNFELRFTVQEVGGRDTDIDFWFEIDGVVVSNIYNRSILENTTTIVNIINVTNLTRTAGDTVTVVVQQKQLGNNREAVVVGTQSVTALRIVQQSAIAIAITSALQFSGNLGQTPSLADISSIITNPKIDKCYQIFDTSGNGFHVAYDGVDFWYEKLTKAN